MIAAKVKVYREDGKWTYRIVTWTQTEHAGDSWETCVAAVKAAMTMLEAWKCDQFEIEIQHAGAEKLPWTS